MRSRSSATSSACSPAAACSSGQRPDRLERRVLRDGGADGGVLLVSLGDPRRPAVSPAAETATAHDTGRLSPRSPRACAPRAQARARRADRRDHDLQDGRVARRRDVEADAVRSRLYAPPTSVCGPARTGWLFSLLGTDRRRRCSCAGSRCRPRCCGSRRCARSVSARSSRSACRPGAVGFRRDRASPASSTCSAARSRPCCSR